MANFGTPQAIAEEGPAAHAVGRRAVGRYFLVEVVTQHER
jgi:hypothetical protein